MAVKVLNDWMRGPVGGDPDRGRLRHGSLGCWFRGSGATAGPVGCHGACRVGRTARGASDLRQPAAAASFFFLWIFNLVPDSDGLGEKGDGATFLRHSPPI